MLLSLNHVAVDRCCFHWTILLFMLVTCHHLSDLGLFLLNHIAVRTGHLSLSYWPRFIFIEPYCCSCRSPVIILLTKVYFYWTILLFVQVTCHHLIDQGLFNHIQLLFSSVEFSPLRHLVAIVCLDTKVPQSMSDAKELLKCVVSIAMQIFSLRYYAYIGHSFEIRIYIYM